MDHDFEDSRLISMGRIPTKALENWISDGKSFDKHPVG